MGARIVLTTLAIASRPSGFRGFVQSIFSGVSRQQRRYLATKSWEDLGLSNKVCNTARKYWQSPNEVQEATIGPILSGSDVIIGAETGSGKTLAYLLPIMDRLFFEIDKNSTHLQQYPRVLILVPNRELATQARRVAKQLGFELNPNDKEEKVLSLDMRYGSSGLWPYRPGRCPDILVCTPSFADCFHKDLDLWSNLQVLVLDEADALLDGSSKDILDRILVALKRVKRLRERLADDVFFNKIEKNCQRIVVAATLPNYGLKSVDALLNKHFEDAQRISGLRMHAPVDTLDQDFIDMSDADDDESRTMHLLSVLDPNERTMIFLNTARAAQDLYEFLLSNNLPVAAYHKNISPDQRIAALDAFARAEVSILCCTDLAARGLDLPDVKHVIQFQFALNVVSHLHRIGRAARAGNRGRATNFYDEQSRDLVAAIRNSLLETNAVDASFSRRRGFRQKN
mmetsp:Transcript_8051/g.12286  ORF Transcript_8051/g.12286 Transcript_8051/m.12286 type:complete len:456 (-) Transcript_8051:426-1793(-)